MKNHKEADRLMEKALLLAESGSFVFPLKPRSKEPKSGLRWRQAATRDPRRIERWWNEAPYNIGWDVGRSGRFVVDLDLKDGIDGRWNFWHLLMDHGLPNPETFMARTPSGGLHLHYRAPASHPLANSAGKLGPGIDTRGVGGYVVAPGSVTAAGRYSVYRDAPLSELPQPILELLRPRTPERGHVPLRVDLSRYGAAALRGELERLATTTEGSRNSELNLSAFRLGRLCGAGLLDRNDVTELLTQAGTQIGLSEQECQTTIRSGLTAGEKQPRHLVSATNLSIA